MIKVIIVVFGYVVLSQNTFKLEAVKQFVTGEAHTDMIATLSFYKDGSRFVTGSDDMTAKVWSMSDFSNVFTTPAYGGSVMHISLHPDDGRIFILTYDGII